MNGKQRLVGAVVIVRISARCHANMKFHIFSRFFFVGSQVWLIRGSKYDNYTCRPAQNIKYTYCCLICIFLCFGVWQLLSLFFCTPWPSLYQYLAIHVERAGPTFRPSQAHVGSFAPKGPAQDLGECLNVYILARITLPQVKLTFINVYGGT